MITVWLRTAWKGWLPLQLRAIGGSQGEADPSQATVLRTLGWIPTRHRATWDAWARSEIRRSARSPASSQNVTFARSRWRQRASLRGTDTAALSTSGAVAMSSSPVSRRSTVSPRRRLRIRSSSSGSTATSGNPSDRNLGLTPLVSQTGRHQSPSRVMACIKTLRAQSHWVHQPVSTIRPDRLACRGETQSIPPMPQFQGQETASAYAEVSLALSVAPSARPRCPQRPLMDPSVLTTTHDWLKPGAGA